MSKVQSNQAFKWLLLIALLLVVPLLIWLGFWQLERASQKEEMLRNLHKGDVVDLRTLMMVGDVGSYQTVRIHGRFDTSRFFLLDNKIRNGVVGYEVIGLLQHGTDEVIMVNAGWVKAGLSRQQLPSVRLPSEDQSLIGSILEAGRGFVLSEQLENRQWPIVIQRLNSDLLSELLDKEVLPYEVKLRKPLLPELNTEWPLQGMTSEKHKGYALQWFAMAAALLLLIVWAWQQMLKEQRHE